jgi:hypothetical protein
MNQEMNPEPMDRSIDGESEFINEKFQALDDKSGDSEAFSGILVIRGTQPIIPVGGLVIGYDENGQCTSSLKLLLHGQVFHLWLEIALTHLIESKKNTDILLLKKQEAKANGNSPIFSELELEFIHGMQSIVASATAIDAFYATVKNHVQIPKDQSKAWGKKRTARYKQISETFKVAFKLNPELTNKLQNSLKEIYGFRDLAVHPPSEAVEAVLHPELQVGVEPRFIKFGSHNAKEIFTGVCSIIEELLKIGYAKKHLKINASCEGWLLLLETKQRKWESVKEGFLE